MGDEKNEEKREFTQEHSKDDFALDDHYKQQLYEKLGHADVLTENASIPDVEFLFEKP